jgi:hypothetical protein
MHKIYTFLIQFTLVLICCTGLITCTDHSPESKYFEIRVIDRETGRGIPLIGLTPLNNATLFTDSKGFIAFYEPGLMHENLYFKIDGEGYQFKRDKTGREAVTLFTKPGDSATILMTRTVPAERLYRTTGQGIYRDSYLLGKASPIGKPLINGKVLGQDSNLGAIYNGKIFWLWGDTFLPSEYEGNFSVSAATSSLPGKGGLDPDSGIDYTYFVDADGASRNMINLSDPGLVWFEWLLNIPDKFGQEQLVAKYARVNGLWENDERGIAVFNDQLGIFESYKTSPDWLEGYAVMHHPFKGFVDGNPLLYLTSEFKFTRVVPDLDKVSEPALYESYSCLQTGSDYDQMNPKIDRDGNGNLQYGWKLNTAYIDQARQQELIDSGHIHSSEGWTQLTDVKSGDPVQVKRGSIYWNNFLNKWILIAAAGGKKTGHIIFAEADTPVGPWAYCTTIAEHDNYLYNPAQHPFLDKNGGQTIYFEGTYTRFWGKGSVKPYYNYNQLMYRLSMERQELFLPVPVYRMKTGDFLLRKEIEKDLAWESIESIAFFAFDPNRKTDDLIPIYKISLPTGYRLSTQKNGEPLFYALPSFVDHAETTLGIWDCHINGFDGYPNYFAFNIFDQQDGLAGNALTDPFIISNCTYKNDELVLEIEYRKRNYTMLGKIIAGKIEGSWYSNDNQYEGTWSGESRQGIWHPKYTPVTILTDNLGQEVDNLNSSICRVWENPFSQLILDYKTRPSR